MEGEAGVKARVSNLIRELCGVSCDSSKRRYVRDGRGTIRVREDAGVKRQGTTRRHLKRLYYATPRKERAALVAKWRRLLAGYKAAEQQ